MGTDDNDRLVEIFDRVVSLPAPERAGALDELCAGDPAMHQKVADLLHYHDSREPMLDPDGDAASRDAIEFAENHRIGKYEVIGKLCEGGMGAIYAVKRSEPYVQNLALKIVKPLAGASLDDLSDRFEQERQILAELSDDDRIVKIIDAGATDEGFPYYVMPLVAGKRVTDYARQQSERDRIAVLREVALGVSRAHAGHVAHLDLKPDNILVDEAGKPKILDFGVAKRLTNSGAGDGAGNGDGDGELRVATAATFASPWYASPEQLRDGSPLSARSDVYSLGVILHEMTMSTSPYECRACRMQEMGDLVRSRARQDLAFDTAERSALTFPSSWPDRLRWMTSRLRSILFRPHSDPDLDAILKKALAIDPPKRYASAGELAEDLGRYLDDRPLEHQRRNLLHALRKFADRHHRAITSAFFTALLGMVIAFVLLARQWSEQRQVQADRLAESAIHESSKDPELSRELAYKAVVASPTELALDAVRVVLRSEQQNVLRGHRSDVELVAFSKDGTFVATADEREFVALWTIQAGIVKSGRSLGPIKGVERLEFSDDNRVLAIYAYSRVVIEELADKGVRFELPLTSKRGKGDATRREGSKTAGDAASEALIKRVGAAGEQLELAVALPDGHRVLASTAKGGVGVWDIDRTEAPAILKAEGDEIRELQIGTEELIAFVPSTTGPEVWNLRTGKQVYHAAQCDAPTDCKGAIVLGEYIVVGRTLLFPRRGPGSGIGTPGHVAYSPDGRYIAIAPLDNRDVQIWSLQSRRRLATLRAGDSGIHRPQFSADGQKVLGMTGGGVVVWETVSGRQLIKYPGAPGPSNDVATFNPTGDLVALTAANNTVQIRDMEGLEIATLRGHGGPVRVIAFDASGTMVATGSADQTARIWRPVLPAVISRSPRFMFDVLLSGDGKTLATLAEGVVTLWNPKGWTRSWTKEMPPDAFRIRLNHDASRIAVAGSNDVTLWNVASNTRLLHIPRRDPRELGFVDNALVIRTEQSIDVINANDGSVISHREFKADETVTFGRGDRHVIHVSSGIQLLALPHLQPRKVMYEPVERDRLRAMSVSPDGTWFFAATDDNEARLIDLRTGTQSRFEFTGARLEDAIVSPSGRLIAGISDVGAVQIWTADGRKVSEFDLESGGWIREFSPDEKMLFTTTTQYGLESRELTIWLVRSGQRAYSFWGTAGIVDWNRRAMLIGTLSGELREFSLPLVGRNTSEIYRQFGERPFREYSDSELARYASGGGR